MRLFKLTLVLAIAAPFAADGTVGSVISSFRLGMSGKPPVTLGVYRDATYVYTICYHPEVKLIWCYTTAGSLVRSAFMDPVTRPPTDTDRCHLGTGYLSLTTWWPQPYYLYFADTASGSIAGSFPISPPGYEDPTVVTWDGTRYYVARLRFFGRPEFARYTATGGYAGTWTPQGWPSDVMYVTGIAFGEHACNNSGSYLIARGINGASQPRTMIFNISSGSLIASWSLDRGYTKGMVYGPSSQPAVYGGALWLNLDDGLWSWAYQVDIDARNATTVLPASVGRIKAIYR
jgi:hypothetical protein